MGLHDALDPDSKVLKRANKMNLRFIIDRGPNNAISRDRSGHASCGKDDANFRSQV